MICSNPLLVFLALEQLWHTYSSSMLTPLWQSMVPLPFPVLPNGTATGTGKHALEQCAVSGACWRLEVLEPNGDGFTKGLGLGGLGMAVHSGFNT